MARTRRLSMVRATLVLMALGCTSLPKAVGGYTPYPVSFTTSLGSVTQGGVTDTNDIRFGASTILPTYSGGTNPTTATYVIAGVSNGQASNLTITVGGANSADGLYNGTTNDNTPPPSNPPLVPAPLEQSPIPGSGYTGPYTHSLQSGFAEFTFAKFSMAFSNGAFTLANPINLDFAFGVNMTIARPDANASRVLGYAGTLTMTQSGLTSFLFNSSPAVDLATSTASYNPLFTGAPGKAPMTALIRQDDAVSGFAPNGVDAVDIGSLTAGSGKSGYFRGYIGAGNDLSDADAQTLADAIAMDVGAPVFSTSVVPEPSSILLFAIGGLAWTLARRRKMGFLGD